MHKKDQTEVLLSGPGKLKWRQTNLPKSDLKYMPIVFELTRNLIKYSLVN